MDSDGKMFEEVRLPINTEAMKTFDITKKSSMAKRSIKAGLEHEYCIITRRS
ncbi:hypothetical protein CHISP_3543 [Chitinispirillum alkaliphilum]|nr:hypothetical protein CHISP_3543 [Chitinispirillum alkaliphilum]